MRNKVTFLIIKGMLINTHREAIFSKIQHYKKKKENSQNILLSKLLEEKVHIYIW